MDSFLYISIFIFIIIYFTIDFLFALVSLSDRIKVVDLYNKGNKEAIFIVEVLNNKRILIRSMSFNKFLLCLLGISFLWVNLSHLEGDLYIILSIVLFSLALSIYCFNMFMSTFLREPEKTIVKFHKLLKFYLKYNLYYGTSKMFEKLQLKNFAPKSLVSYEDLSIALSSYDKELTINENGYEKIKDVLEFNNSFINDSSIITHRINIFALNEELTKKEAFELIKKHEFKRIPVFKGNIDKIIGYIDRMVFMSDFEKNPEGLLKDYLGISKHLMLFESTSKSIALERMLENDTSLCVVLDEYGGTRGIVTKNDLIKSRNKKRKSN